ncbi:DNA-binding protein [Burkholderia lata]|uniref:DNA-binding protein n=1 Tax=Burkholderia lata (strain ATCC 17760 / DSM 23089 / LMG 22485 / NCIMB 9086 / R18194 / 383) TaxID=482957 RepID=UPI001582DCB8|nr:DNA-binding protein [Burkholderia lata]
MIQRIEPAAVAARPVDAEFPLHEAAAWLDVSPPYLIEWLESNGVSTRQVGSVRRVRVIDLLRCRDARDQASMGAMAELSRQRQVLKMGYD